MSLPDWDGWGTLFWNKQVWRGSTQWNMEMVCKRRVWSESQQTVIIRNSNKNTEWSVNSW